VVLRGNSWVEEWRFGIENSHRPIVRVLLIVLVGGEPGQKAARLTINLATLAQS